MSESYRATVWTGGRACRLDEVPAAARGVIDAAVLRGRASGRFTLDGETYRWGLLTTVEGTPILDSRAYGGAHRGGLPGWMRTPTGA